MADVDRLVDEYVADTAFLSSAALVRGRPSYASLHAMGAGVVVPELLRRLRGGERSMALLIMMGDVVGDTPQVSLADRGSTEALTQAWLEWGEAQKAYDPDQPRVPKGAPGGGRWTRAGGQVETDIRSYLQMVAAMFGDRQSFEGFLLEHGQHFPHDEDSLRGDAPLGECYRNAANLALSSPGLTYAEGIVTIHGVPIQHAWTIDGDGRVVDPTFGRTQASYTGEYYGVPVRSDYLRETLVRTGYYGVFQHTNRDWLTRDPADMVAGRVAGRGGD